ncbi:unnamed protein product, partial [Adineta ricciae]
KSETKIWRTKDEKWREGCMAVAATGGGGRAGFWGVITWKGAGCFRIYTENTNSEVYCNILDNYLVPTVQMYGFENDFMLQHDNAVLQWPAKSPDLNPVEQLWSFIDNKLKSRRMSSIKELIDGLSAEWLNITPELCEKIVFSMPQRIQNCIKFPIFVRGIQVWA